MTHCDDEENVRMRALLDKGVLETHEVNVLVEYAKQNGGIEYAYDTMRKLRDEAVLCIEKFQNNNSRQALLDLLDYTISRDI